MAIDCIAFARIPTAAWSMPVAAQNRVTRSPALSLVVAFVMIYCRGSLLTSGTDSPYGIRAWNLRNRLRLFWI
jgi:hypothetical protein